MNVIIYESSSFGGCYEYSKHLLVAYQNSNKFEEAKILLPNTADYCNTGVIKKLINDQKKGKLNFLWRTFINPFILFYYLINQPKSFVLLNDFEQISAPIWTIFYRLFLRKHLFSVFLHDTNRDDYPPSYKYSVFCMKQIMSTVEIAYYHGLLPNKPYYNNSKTKYLKVIHGLYPSFPLDKQLKIDLENWTKNFKIIVSVPGNIRYEKNYKLILNVLADFPEIGLIIAGSASNSSVDINDLIQIARDSGSYNQLKIIDRFLTDQEMAVVISISDWIILYYSASFSAQSGILNQVVVYKRPVLVSDNPNALTQTVKEFNLGRLCKTGDVDSLKEAFREFLVQPNHITDWDAYYKAADWNQQVELTFACLKNR